MQLASVPTLTIITDRVPSPNLKRLEWPMKSASNQMHSIGNFADSSQRYHSQYHEREC